MAKAMGFLPQIIMNFIKYILLCFCFILLGCGSVSKNLFIKQPIQQACTSRGLKGCVKLTDALLLYIDGEKEQGTKKFIEGAAQNSPKEINEFIVVVSKIPELSEIAQIASNEVDKKTNRASVKTNKESNVIVTSDTVIKDYLITKDYFIIIHYSNDGEIINCWYEQNIDIIVAEDQAIYWKNRNGVTRIKGNYLVVKTLYSYDVIGQNLGIKKRCITPTSFVWHHKDSTQTIEN